MARTRSPVEFDGDDDHWDDDLQEDQDWSENQDDTVECAHCGAEIYDDSPQCPICGEYQTRREAVSSWQGRPWWWKIGGLIGIIAVILSLILVNL